MKYWTYNEWFTVVTSALRPGHSTGSKHCTTTFGAEFVLDQFLREFQGNEGSLGSLQRLPTDPLLGFFFVERSFSFPGHSSGNFPPLIN